MTRLSTLDEYEANQARMERLTTMIKDMEVVLDRLEVASRAISHLLGAIAVVESHYPGTKLDKEMNTLQQRATAFVHPKRFSWIPLPHLAQLHEELCSQRDELKAVLSANPWYLDPEEM